MLSSSLAELNRAQSCKEMQLTVPVSGLGRDRLTPTDYALLVLLAVLVGGFHLGTGRLLTAHETIHCRNIQEMHASGNWIIPTCGGRVWLERPPLPHWLTALGVAMVGDWECSWAYQISSLLAGLVIVLLTANTAAWLLGRDVGLLAGAVLATTHEMIRYSTNPECDIFLCAIVTAGLACVVRIEFAVRPNLDNARSAAWPGFWAAPSWWLVGLCVCLGVANAAKGLFFGDLFMLIPLVGFWAMCRQPTRVLPYVNAWAWLLLAVLALAWPLTAYWHHPDVLDLWRSDYLGRYNQGYMREPAWYYLLVLPEILLPWSPLAAVGVVLVARRAWADRCGPVGFVFAAAVLPVAAFSLCQGKHHHYLLQCLPAWAIVIAIATRAAYGWLNRLPAWLRYPTWNATLAAVVGSSVIVLVSRLLAMPDWLTVVCAVGYPILVYAYWQAANRGRAYAAGVVLFVGIVGAHWQLAIAYEAFLSKRYHEDLTFLAQVRQLTVGERLIIVNDEHPLNMSWLLFYVGRPADAIHNPSFLLDERFTEPNVTVIAKQSYDCWLAQYGKLTLLTASDRSYNPRNVADRWALYRLEFHPNLPRQPAPSISPMQATGRAIGPILDAAGPILDATGSVSKTPKHNYHIKR